MLDQNYYSKNIKESSGNLMRQVGKTVNGEPVDEKQVELISRSIKNNLNLNLKDKVLDLCCGNGLLTNKTAHYVDSVKGVDIHEDLINIARRNSAFNASYETGSALDYHYKDKDYNKVYMYDAQFHFSHIEFKYGLKRIRDILNVGTKFLVGAILDAERLPTFLRNEEDKASYFDCLDNNETFIGTWWNKEHIKKTCADLGLECKIIDIDDKSYMSHYRYDALIEF